MKKFGKFVFNFFWVILVGIEVAISNAVLGALCCVTIIGIPLGKQYFKFIKLAFAPAGKVIVTKYSRHPVLNTLWLIFGGFEMMVVYWLLGIVLSITIIGYPLAKQLFKIAKFNFAPFGCEILNEGEYSKEGNLAYDYELLTKRVIANPEVEVNVNGETKTVAKYINENGEEVGAMVKKINKKEKAKTIAMLPVIIVISAIMPIISGKFIGWDGVWPALANIGIALAVAIFVVMILSMIFSSPSKEAMRFYDSKMRWLTEYYPNGSKEEKIAGIGVPLTRFIDSRYIM